MPVWLWALALILVLLYAVGILMVREHGLRLVKDSVGRCQVDGCKRPIHYVVKKKATVLKVCSACGGELSAVHGWTVTGLARLHHGD